MPTRSLIVVMAVVLLTVGPISRAASQTAHTDVSSALIGEVRLLRTTIEQIVSAGASGQLILGRLQLQEQRVNAAALRLETTQTELTRTREYHADAEQALAHFAAALAGGPRRRTSVHHLPDESPESLQEMFESSKKRLGEIAQSTRRLTAEEAEQASALVAEQAVWADLSRRLDDVERMLARKP